jgi:hypothetical protein
MLPTTFPPHSCSYNTLGTAGTKELIKGDWPELRVLVIRWGGLAMLPCIQQRSRGAVRLQHSPHVSIPFHAVSHSWMQKLWHTLQLHAGPSCRSFTCGKRCLVALSVKHMLVCHKHLHTFPSTFCRGNKLGAAGAKELVKRDWPELRVLSIGWGDVRCCSAF